MTDAPPTPNDADDAPDESGAEVQAEARPARGPIARVRGFVALYAEHARDGLGGAVPRVLAITGISFLGVTAQGATIGALSVFLRAIQQEPETTTTIAGIELGRDTRSLLLLVVTLLVLQIASALAIYFAAAKSRRLARAHHERTAARLLTRFEAARAVDASALDRAAVEIRQGVLTLPRVLGKATETILSLIQGACYAIGYVVVLFLLSVEITLLVLPIFAIVLPFLYRLGSSTQGAAKAFYGRTRSELTAAVRRTVARGDRSNLDAMAAGRDLAARYFDEPCVREYYDAYDAIQLAASRSVLVTSLVRPVVLCLILLVLGSFALRRSYSWDVVLPYMLALWQFLNSVQHVAAHAASLYRFHPRVTRYRSVLAAIGPARSSDPPRRLKDAIEIASGQRIEGGAATLRLERGDRVLYAVDARLGRIGFLEVVTPLADASNAPRGLWLDARFVADRDAAPGVSARTLVGADGLDGLRRLGAEGEIAARAGGPDAPLDDEAWRGLTPGGQAALLVLALAAAPADVVLLDLRVLDGLDEADASARLAALDGKVTLLTTMNPAVERVDATGFLIAQQGRVIGAGDAAWWRSCRTERDRLRIEMQRRRGAAPDADADDDEDDDE